MSDRISFPSTRFFSVHSSLSLFLAPPTPVFTNLPLVQIHSGEAASIWHADQFTDIGVNMLWPSGTIWWHRFWSTLVQVMACSLTLIASNIPMTKAAFLYWAALPCTKCLRSSMTAWLEVHMMETIYDVLSILHQGSALTNNYLSPMKPCWIIAINTVWFFAFKFTTILEQGIWIGKNASFS